MKNDRIVIASSMLAMYPLMNKPPFSLAPQHMAKAVGKTSMSGPVASAASVLTSTRAPERLVHRSIGSNGWLISSDMNQPPVSGFWLEELLPSQPATAEAGRPSTAATHGTQFLVT